MGDPNGKYACTGRTNQQLFTEAAKNSALDYERLDPRCCYMFERVHPDFRVVLDYPEAKLFHLGTRNMETLQELEDEIGEVWGDAFGMRRRGLRRTP